MTGEEEKMKKFWLIAVILTATAAVAAVGLWKADRGVKGLDSRVSALESKKEVPSQGEVIPQETEETVPAPAPAPVPEPQPTETGASAPVSVTEIPPPPCYGTGCGFLPVCPEGFVNPWDKDRDGFCDSDEAVAGQCEVHCLQPGAGLLPSPPVKKTKAVAKKATAKKQQEPTVVAKATVNVKGESSSSSADDEDDKGDESLPKKVTIESGGGQILYVPVRVKVKVHR